MTWKKLNKVVFHERKFEWQHSALGKVAVSVTTGGELMAVVDKEDGERETLFLSKEEISRSIMKHYGLSPPGMDPA